MVWFSQHSAAIQAFSALAIVFLTVVLIRITNRYVKSTQAMVRIMERDSAIRLQPRIIPSIKYKWDGRTAKGSLRLENPGPNDAILRRVELDYYCSHSKLCQTPPKEYRLLVYRVIPAKQWIEEDFQTVPDEDCHYHEPHTGECHWIFQVRVECTDILGLLTHVYSYDEALGIHHFAQHRGGTAGWLRRKTWPMRNKLRHYSYRVRSWCKRAIHR